MPARRPRVAPPAPDWTAALTAATAPLTASGYADGLAGSNNTVDKAWTNAAWGYYNTNGPLNYAVNWLAAALSRISLQVAQVMPGGEPEPVESGPAVDILAKIKFDESAILRSFGVQLSVPGRGYLVGRETTPGQEEWIVYSPDQVRIASRATRGTGTPPVYELHEYGSRWITLDEALVTPVRDADDRYRWRDTSMVRAALPILQEIDLLDKSMMSSLVSRLSRGILAFPSEISFPSQGTRSDNEDPFMLQFLEAVQTAIKNPSSASAAIPLILRLPAQFIDRIRHLTFGEPIDPTAITARKEAFERLADTLNLPREIITGTGQTNHWSSWQIQEEAVKTHVAPLAELIVGQLTTGFLYPQLEANNQSINAAGGGRLVIWYDAAELTMRPDLSTRAIELYDRVEISADTLRRETGFTEEDTPDDKQVREQLLKKVATNAQLALTAIAELTGIPQRASSGEINPPASAGRTRTPAAPASNPQTAPERQPA